MKARTTVIMSIALFVVLAALSAWYLRPTPVKNVDSIDTLKQVLEPHGWSVPRPPRTDWTPGTLLLVDGNAVSVFQTAAEAFPEAEFKRESGSAPYPKVVVALDCANDANARFLAGNNSVTAKGLSNRTFTVALNDTHIQYITRKRLEDGVAINEALKREVSTRPGGLFVITEVLLAKSLQITQTANTGGNVQNDLNLQDTLKVALRTEVQSKSQSEYVVDGPITVGFKLVSLGVVAKSLGDPAAGLDLKLLPPGVGEQEKIGDLEQTVRNNGTAHLRVKTPVHVLAIGLDLYSVNEEARIGGMIPGAPASAAMVATRMRQLCGDDPRCSVTLHAPTLTKGRLRTRVTAAELKTVIEGWKNKLLPVPNAAVDPKSDAEAAYIIYFCGHGVVDSTNGFVVMVPEDYGDVDANGRLLNGGVTWSDARILPNKRSGCLIIMDCCRKEDGYFQKLKQQARIPFHSGFPASSIASMRNSFHGNFPGPGTQLIHAAADNQAAFTIPVMVGVDSHDIGPLAGIVDSVITDVINSSSPLTLLQLTSALMRETLIGKVKVKGEGWFNNWTQVTRERFDHLPLVDRS